MQLKIKGLHSTMTRQKIIISVNLSAIIESKMHMFAEEVLLCLGKEAGGNDGNKKLQAHIEVIM